MRELHGAVHDLLYVRADANLVVVAHVAAHETALIEHVLQPVNEFVAAAARFAFLRGGRHAGEHEHGHTPLRGVVNRAGQ